MAWDTSERARASRLWTLALVFLLLGWLSPGPASAQAGAGEQPARQKFATVWRLSGTLSAAFGDASAARQLHPGDAVYVGDRLQAEAASDAVLQTEDAAYVAMRPGAHFAVDQYLAEGKTTDRFTLRLLQGSLRLLSGWVAKLHPQAYRIITPTSTVGIRGTDHETYVLTEELAQAMAQTAGTYDKVNRGATVLQTSAGSVDIEPGKVGFARLLKPRKTRAVITLILPVILEQVPNFYLPGAFDAELDTLAGSPLAQAPGGTLAAAPPASATAATTAPGTPPATLAQGQCNAQAVASHWLEQLDSAVARNDAPAVLSLFAPDAEVSGTVLDANGKPTTVHMDRTEFAASSLAALNSLSQYRQRRLSLTAKPLQAGHCAAVTLRSAVIEQGLQNGKPYRFKTLEQYELAWRDGQWLAVKASTRQL